MSVSKTKLHIDTEAKISDLKWLSADEREILTREDTIRIPKDDADYADFSNEEKENYEKLKKAKERAAGEFPKLLSLYVDWWNKRNAEIMKANIDAVNKKAAESRARSRAAESAKAQKISPKPSDKKASKAPVEKKYHLSEKYEIIEGRVAYHIVADRDFGNIKKGDVGGAIEHEDNLSHEGDCWVYPEGSVIEWAHVTGDAQVISGTVRQESRVGERAKIIESSVSGKACVHGDATIRDSYLDGTAEVFGKAYINHESYISGTARIGGEASFFHTYKNDGVYGGRQEFINDAEMRSATPGKDFPVMADDPKYGNLNLDER